MFKEYKWLVYVIALFSLLVVISVVCINIGYGRGERAAQMQCAKEKAATQLTAITNNTKSTAIGNEYEDALKRRDTDLAELVRDQNCVSVDYPASQTVGATSNAKGSIGGNGNAVNSATLYRFAGRCEGWRIQVIGLIKENDLVRSICGER